MPDFSTLAYLPDLFGVGIPTFALRAPGGTSKIISAEEVSAAAGPVVSFETNLLVDQLRASGRSPPPGLIEVGDAMKLRAGRSKSDGGVKAWDFWRELHRSGGGIEPFPFTRELFFARVEPPSVADVERSLTAACDLIFDVWNRNAQSLAERDEADRFLGLETKVQSIFFRRQAEGIKLNKDAVRSFLQTAKEEKYAAYVNVAETLRVSPTGLTFRNIGQYLDRTDASHLSEFANSPNVEEHFKIAAEGSSFAVEFLSYVRSSRDVNTLNRLLVPDERIYPYFHVMGTVTGRVLVSEPFLQQLRRRFRGVLSPDDGNSLVYLDYRQFEPGIMADLSGDASFIEAYNSTDLYSSLSQVVFEDDDHRSLCKRVFLSFCYGMTRSGLAALLLGASPKNGEREKLEAKLQQFFDRYPGLEKLRDDLQNRLRQDGFVASLWGNRRYRLVSGALTPEERRWSLSQRIQGTAALIFKEALVDIADRLGPECIVLPMHDAILLQFPSSNADRSKKIAAEIMAAKFQARCPAIVPKISDEPFAP